MASVSEIFGWFLIFFFGDLWLYVTQNRFVYFFNFFFFSFPTTTAGNKYENAPQSTKVTNIFWGNGAKTNHKALIVWVNNVYIKTGAAGLPDGLHQIRKLLFEDDQFIQDLGL